MIWFYLAWSAFGYGLYKEISFENVFGFKQALAKSPFLIGIPISILLSALVGAGLFKLGIHNYIDMDKAVGQGILSGCSIFLIALRSDSKNLIKNKDGSIIIPKKTSSADRYIFFGSLVYLSLEIVVRLSQ